MSFVARMLQRELRSSWRRLIFFFLCVAVGVGGIVALRSVIQNVRVALMAEARTLTAGDVYLRTDQVWTDDIRAIVDERVREIPGTELTETVDTTTMVRAVWHCARSSVYARRQATPSPAPCRRRGPVGAAPDDVMRARRATWGAVRARWANESSACCSGVVNTNGTFGRPIIGTSCVRGTTGATNLFIKLQRQDTSSSW